MSDLVPTPDPMSLLAAAVEKGVDADQLEKLVALQERWEANQARKAFFTAMTACQAEMPTVVKMSKNKHTDSQYAPLEDLVLPCKPIYIKHGFSVSFSTADSPREGLIRITGLLRHNQGHSENYQIDLPPDGHGAKGGANMNEVQGGVSTNTYGCRTLFVRMFNITVAGQDNDAQGIPRTINLDQCAQIDTILTQKRRTRAGFFDYVSKVAKFPIESIAEIPLAIWPKVEAALTNMTPDPGIKTDPK